MWLKYCTIKLAIYCTFGYILRHVLTALNSDIVNLLNFVDEVVLCFEKMT